MRYTLYILIMCLYAFNVQAQDIHMGPLHSMDSPRTNWLLPGDTLYQDGKPLIYEGKPVELKQEQKSLQDSNKSETMNYLQNYGSLHEGLNASVGVSAFATFGKNVPHKGGLTENINLTYLKPLTKDGKLWMMAGGYLNHMNWGGDSYRDVGLYGVLGYKFNEHWEAYLYGQLSINNNYDNLYSRYGGWGMGRYGVYGYSPWMWSAMNPVMPFGYGMGAAGANVLGAGAIYHVNKNFSIGFNIEGIWYDNGHTPSYYGKYKYPTPSNHTAPAR